MHQTSPVRKYWISVLDSSRLASQNDTIQWGADMITYILIILIAISGLIMIAGGIWGLVSLLNQPSRPLRYYAAVIGMIGGGLGLWGIAQGLRIGLVLIVLENAHR